MYIQHIHGYPAQMETISSTETKYSDPFNIVVLVSDIKARIYTPTLGGVRE